MDDRLYLASHRPTVVVASHGLLARFNDAGVINPLDTLAASTIARLAGETDESVHLAAALTVRGTRLGHVCIRLEDAGDSVVVDDGVAVPPAELPWPDVDEWAEAVSASGLVGDGEGDEPLVLVGGRLYLERYYRYEQRVARQIETRLAAPPRPLPDPARTVLDGLLTTNGAPTRQHRAAVTALTGQVAVIAGGPGTGKTFTIGVLLAALAADPERDFPLVALCAPTGKAAARLGEAIAELAAGLDPALSARLATVAPSTIHRLLGWSWDRGRFRHDATNRLPHDLVIVDEMSMVSLPTAAKLFDAVRDDAGVIVVGDPFQLESIEAGTVLADIVGPAGQVSPPEAAIGGRVVVLERGRRFEADSTIAGFADAVRLARADDAVALLGSDPDQLRWVRGASDPAFADLWREVLAQRFRVVESAMAGGDPSVALDVLGELAILCARKRGPGGVAQWSRDLEAALDERYPGLRWNGEWYPGRPVMITRNDYQLDLYNGDIGVAVATEEGLRAVFDRGGVRRFPLSHLTEHTTVHALTIHKSQGSQFEQVVVVLPDEESPLLTRELLYTAVTRARKRVWLVGSEPVIRAAIARSVPRASGLGSLLWTRA